MEGTGFFDLKFEGRVFKILLLDLEWNFGVEGLGLREVFCFCVCMRVYVSTCAFEGEFVVRVIKIKSDDIDVEKLEFCTLLVEFRRVSRVESRVAVL